jgi:hypothetical protein
LYSKNISKVKPFLRDNITFSILADGYQSGDTGKGKLDSNYNYYWRADASMGMKFMTVVFWVTTSCSFVT